VGHAAWSEGQLEREIQEGRWYVLPASADLVFSADDEMWQQGMRDVGTALFHSVTGLVPLPGTHLLN
jgi:putative transcriptional regulator